MCLLCSSTDTTLWISHLPVKLDCFDKVSQQIVGVAQVPVGSPLSSSVSEFFDQTQIHPTGYIIHTALVAACQLVQYIVKYM